MRYLYRLINIDDTNFISVKLKLRYRIYIVDKNKKKVLFYRGINGDICIGKTTWFKDNFINDPDRLSICS